MSPEIGSSDTFATALVGFAEAYGDQTEHDHAALVVNPRAYSKTRFIVQNHPESGLPIPGNLSKKIYSAGTHKGEIYPESKGRPQSGPAREVTYQTTI